MAPSGYENSKLSPSINLNNKQVYLAQVPADFDIASARFKSDTEVVANGVTYFVNSSAVLADCKVLNEEASDEYTPSKINISGLLALTQKVQLPKVDFAKVHQPKQKVPQRLGMEMRHFPSGYGRNNYGITKNASKSAAGKTSEVTPTESKEKTKKKHKRDHKEKDNEGRKKRKKEKKA